MGVHMFTYSHSLLFYKGLDENILIHSYRITENWTYYWVTLLDGYNLLLTWVLEVPAAGGPLL